MFPDHLSRRARRLAREKLAALRNSMKAGFLGRIEEAHAKLDFYRHVFGMMPYRISWQMYSADDESFLE